MAALVALLAVSAENTAAQITRPDPASLVPGDTVLISPADRYPANFLHRFALGAGHRDLWGLPIPVAVLDLDAYAGGLRLLRRGGGNQTSSLRFAGADGRAYTFRSVDKDASRGLDPAIRETAAAWILQDQVSSLFPLSAMVVAPIVRAGGLLLADPELRVMPDDPRLGEFREEFAGMLGWIEERPNEEGDSLPGFAGSRRVVGTDRLFELLEEDPRHRVNDEAFLRARLIDALVGDWDRHPDQWRWARYDFEDHFLYEPVPRDRDWALARIDGAITWFTWIPWPQYMGFGDDIGDPFRRMWNGQALDRRLLTELEWEDWSTVVEDVSLRITDEVIEDAVGRLPNSYRIRIGDELARRLERRRDQLPAFARAWYELLGGWVDVRGSDEEDRAEVTRLGADSVRVRLFAADEEGAAAEPWYERAFTGGVTREVRLDLHGDDDLVVVEGAPEGTIDLRIVGGGGDDRLVDRTSGRGVTFYDDEDSDFETAPYTTVVTREWDPPYEPEDRTDRVPPRDWGARTLPVAKLSYVPDWGVVAAVGARRTSYGFQRYPWESRLTGLVGVASATRRVYGSVELEAPLTPSMDFRIFGETTGAEIWRFYGFGNDTEAEVVDSDRFHAERRRWGLSAGVSRELGRGRWAVDAVYRRYDDLGNEGALIEELMPYGYPDFQQLGVSARYGWEGPDPDSFLGTADALRMEVVGFPALLDVETAFARVGATAGTSLGLTEPESVPVVLHLAGGGRAALGDYPYHDAAFLGGEQTLRGYRNQRFAGDAAVHARTELRVGVGALATLLPGDVGVFGVAEAGRVFHERDGSGGLHTSVGGGLWLSFLGPYKGSIAVVRGEITGIYVEAGFPF